MATARAARSAIRIKTLTGIAHRAHIDVGNALGRNTHARKAAPQRSTHIDVALVDQACLAERIEKLLGNFFANLEMARMDIRADIHVEAFRGLARKLTKRRKRRRPGAVHDPAPSAMRHGELAGRRHNNHRRAIGKAQQGRNIIATHGNRVAAFGRELSRLGDIASVFAYGDIGAMHLVGHNKPRRIDAERLADPAAILTHAFGIVVDMKAQVQRIVRRHAHAARALGKRDAYAACFEQGLIGKCGQVRKTTLDKPRERQIEGRFKP